MRPLSAANVAITQSQPPSRKFYFRHKCLWVLLTQGRAQPVAGPCRSPPSPWRRANLYAPKRMALPFCLPRLRAPVYIPEPPPATDIFPQNNEGSVFASFQTLTLQSILSIILKYCWVKTISCSNFSTSVACF